MKVVTVNIPESYIDAIKKLVGEKGLFPSRSELVRVACRDFLIRELRITNNVAKEEINVEIQDYDKESYVKVPVEQKNEKNEPIREFKTYKILKRLEDIYPNNEIHEKKSENNKIDCNNELKRRPRKNRVPLGNLYWDKNGNLIITRKDAEILNK